MKLQIDIPKLQNRILELYQVKFSFKNKQEALVDIINSFKEDFSEEDLNRDWRLDNATEKQLDFLKGRGINVKDNLSKFEASTIIKSLKREN